MCVCVGQDERNRRRGAAWDYTARLYGSAWPTPCGCFLIWPRTVTVYVCMYVYMYVCLKIFITDQIVFVYACMYVCMHERIWFAHQRFLSTTKHDINTYICYIQIHTQRRINIHIIHTHLFIALCPRRFCSSLSNTTWYCHSHNNWGSVTGFSTVFQ